MSTYRTLDAVGEAYFQPGEFEHDFTAVEERDWLASGHLELVPRRYRVLSHRYADGAKGDLVEAALSVDIEAVLVRGGHLERVDGSPSPKRKKE